MNFKLGELFCGPGGIAWGALNADVNNPEWSISHAWANDFDHNTCETYRNNICPLDRESVFEGDVKNLDFSTLPEFNALAFGFPCNDYSMIGERRGINGSYGPLYSYGIKALIRFQPLWFLAENVGGLRNSNEGRTFTKILNEMQAAGYNIYPHLYKFEEYGIPQARHRIIIVGIRNDQKVEFKPPSPVNYEIKTCREAIEIPPIAEDATNNEITRQSKTVIERLEHIKPGENAFTADLPEHLKLNVVGVQISQIYKRLEPDKPAYTVTGSGGGGTHIYHWTQPRALTNRERARLQTFGDDYTFFGNKESVRKQIGMAVPCQGVKIIFEAILKTFANIPYDFVECNATEYMYSGGADIRWQFDSNLEEKILIQPAFEGANELKIISAYASPSMASWHMEKLRDAGFEHVKISLIVGMCPFDGLSLTAHRGFQKLQAETADVDSPCFKCHYIYQTPPIHSKMFLWLKNGKPYCAFTGSANYTLKGFSQDCGELMLKSDADEAASYFNTVEGKSIFCDSPEVENYIRIYRNQPIMNYETANADIPKEKPLTISLLDKTGHVSKSSGLNWGQREKRNPNQAYIPLPSKFSKINFFPLNKRHFTIVTDDGISMILRVEQANDKAITTPGNNAELGIYFRERLGLEPGQAVTTEDLIAYGRTDVDFIKLDDEHFIMDFSVPED